MKVAIAQVDGKWPNLALAKLCAHHRTQGDEVEHFVPLMSGTYATVYASKVFTWSRDEEYLPEGAVKGGSAYDLAVKLPVEIERLKPDWSLWPRWEHDMGYTTRGCVRKCAFCIVPQKEGRLHVVAEFGDIWTGRRTMYINDNNITAAPIEHFRTLCDEASAAGVFLNFNQGLDARLLTEEHAHIFGTRRCFKEGPPGRWRQFSKRIKLAFDNVADEVAVRRSVDLVKKSAYSHKRLTYYVLIGFDTTPEEDLYRVEVLRELDVEPYVMCYGRGDPYQARFSRWVNTKSFWRSMTWEEFQAKVAPISLEVRP